MDYLQDQLSKFHVFRKLCWHWNIPWFTVKTHKSDEQKDSSYSGTTKILNTLPFFSVKRLLIVQNCWYFYHRLHIMDLMQHQVLSVQPNQVWNGHGMRKVHGCGEAHTWLRSCTWRKDQPENVFEYRSIPLK